MSTLAKVESDRDFNGVAASATLSCLIIGAGQAGRIIARDLRKTPDFGLLPVGFLDDGPHRHSLL
ncbi:MAG: hypothetical protein QOI23_785, partial [Chloroflexota bacterium]|nr:hypothetical protein [Chloroflexota bacterium]